MVFTVKPNDHDLVIMCEIQKSFRPSANYTRENLKDVFATDL